MSCLYTGYLWALDTALINYIFHCDRSLVDLTMTGLHEVPEQKIHFIKDHFRFLFTVSRNVKHIAWANRSTVC